MYKLSFWNSSYQDICGDITPMQIETAKNQSLIQSVPSAEDNLVQDVWMTVFKHYCNTKDLGRLALVSHEFNKFSSLDEVWNCIVINQKLIINLQTDIPVKLRVKEGLMFNLHQEIKKRVTQDIEALCQLTQLLFATNICKLNVTDTNQFTVTLSKEKVIFFNQAINNVFQNLHIPTKVSFWVSTGSIDFEQKCAPFEEASNNFFYSTSHDLDSIKIIQNQFKIVKAQHTQTFGSQFGGTPCVYPPINQKTFFDSVLPPLIMKNAK